MSKNKQSRLQKCTNVLKSATLTKWCRVDIDNFFTFNDSLYLIGENVEDYKVYNKAGEVENYTNEAYMEEIFAVVDIANDIKFYSQNYDLIDDIEEVK